MALTPLNDNIQLNAPKLLDSKCGVFSSGVWRPYNDLSEFLATVNVAYRCENLTFYVRSTTNENRADLYILDKTKTPYKLLEDIDLSNYYTKSEVDGLLTLIEAEIDNNTTAILAETARAIAVENTKANSADIIQPIWIAFGDAGISGNTYTNIDLANKTVALTYNDVDGVHLSQITFNSSGVATLPTTPVAGFSGLIGGSASDISSYVRKDELADLAYTKPTDFGIAVPVTGIGGATRTIIFKERVEVSGNLNRIRAYVTTTATTKIKRFKLSIDGLTLEFQEEIIVPLVAGYNDIAIASIMHFDVDDYISYYTGAQVNYVSEAEWSQYYFKSTAPFEISSDILISALTSSGAGINIQFGYEIEPDNPFLKEEVFEEFTTPSKNLFNKNGSITTGFLSTSTGLPSSGSTSAFSDYTPVEENTWYTLSGTVSLTNTNACVISFYDASKTFISFVAGIANFTHLTPAGTAFVRFNIKFISATTDYSQVQYEQGQEATGYKQYGTVISAQASQIEDVDTTLAPMTDIYMIPCYGQSLSINTDAGPSTFTSPVSIAIDQTGVNTNIQDMNGGYAEMFLALANEFEPLNANFKMMTCLGGAGGKSVRELSKGSSYYNTLIANITAGKAYADANGLTYNVPAFIWTQGEEDYRCGGVPSNWGTGIYIPTLYAFYLQTLINQINVDVKLITGQTNEVKCIMYQLASHNVYARYPRIAMQQLELALSDRRVTLAKTMYELDYNIADYVHAPAKSYRNMGNHYGIGLYEAVIENKRVLPIFPATHYIIGNDIYIRFHVPVAPLAFDTTIVSPLADGNMGFALYNVVNENSGTSGTITPTAETINSVTLFNANTVKLSLSAIPPAGTRLTYGVNGDGGLDIDGTSSGAKSGRTNGARGNLRDSRTYLNPVDNYFTLYNWCPIFEIVL